MALQTLSQRTGRGDVCLTQRREESSQRSWQQGEGIAAPTLQSSYVSSLGAAL